MKPSVWTLLLGTLLFLFSCSAPMSTGRKPDSILFTQASEFQVHQALMEAFFPREFFANDAKALEAYKQFEAGLYIQLKEQPLFQQLFAEFSRMNIESESPETRFAIINDLITNGPAPMNSYVRFLKMGYLIALYDSPLGQKLSGLPSLRLVHPEAEAYLRKNSIKFPKTKLRFDRGSRHLSLDGKEFDVAIVGSGPAGSMIAHELNAAGFSVVLIDKGPLAMPGVMNTRAFAEFKDNLNVRTSSDGAIMFRNGSAVGGGATINIDLAFSPTLPTVRARIERWRKEGRIASQAFSPSEVERAYQYVKQKIGTRVLSESEINANNRVLWEGAKKLGRTPSLYDLNTYRPGTSPSPVNDKRSPVDSLLRPAFENVRNPLIILEETYVERLEQSGSVISRIRLKKLRPAALSNLIQDPHQLNIPVNEEYTLKARNVIISAGALGSPAILLKSRIKNNNIGKGMVGHVSMPIMGVFKRDIKAWEGTDASVYDASSALDKGYILESMSGEPSYVAIMTPGSREQMIQTVSSYSKMAGFGVMLIDEPSSGNQVRLNERGEIVIDYKISESDKKRMIGAVADAVNVMFAGGASKVILPTTENIHGGHFTNSQQVKDILSNYKLIPGKTTVTSAHMQATNKMSTRPSDGVVDPEFKVWGYQNLYVCDGSIFPSSIGANPMQSIYTFAKIFADDFVKKKRKAE